MLPPQGAARHPEHRNEPCVHPPAPALLSAAPFHSLVLPSFSLVCECPLWVTRAQIALWAPVGPALWKWDLSVPRAALPKPPLRGDRDTPAQDGSETAVGTVWDTQRIAGSGHCHSAPVTFP